MVSPSRHSGKTLLVLFRAGSHLAGISLRAYIYLTFEQLVRFYSFDLEETRSVEEIFKMVPPEVIEHAYNPSSRDVKAGISRVQGHTCLRSASGI